MGLATREAETSDREISVSVTCYAYFLPELQHNITPNVFFMSLSIFTILNMFLLFVTLVSLLTNSANGK